MAGAKPLAGVLAAVLLLVSACGGGGKKSPTTAPTTTAAAAPATTTTSAKPLGRAAYDAQMRAGAALVKLQAHLRSAANTLAGIAPPAAIKAKHAALVKAVRDYADELDAVIAKVRNGTLEAASVPSAIVGLPGVGEIVNASSAISNAGYAIGG
jgi:hypothetical protein